MPNEHYDAIIIGSGQAGSPLAVTLAKAGKKTALIERKYVGGTCVNTGCTPTKTMIASAQVAHQARRASDYGITTGRVDVNMAEIRRRKNKIVEESREGWQKRFADLDDVDLVRGEARFTGPKSLEVQMNNGGTRTLEGDLIFINTGGRPAIPPVEGLDQVPALNEAQIEMLDEVPSHLLILGGGYIGVEFGQMFRRFGSEVTIIDNHDRLIGFEDEDVSDQVAEIFREDGITLVMSAEATRVVQDSDGQITMALDTSQGPQTVCGSHLLVAVGRTPNTDALEPEAAGIALDDEGHIQVNKRLETNVAGVYALGDVNGGPAFTHISYDDFRIVRDNVLNGANANTDGRLVPYTVYIDPQLGRVGLTERQARDQGLDIKVAKMPMSSVARAIETGQTRGFMKAIVDANTDQILGCAVLGMEGGELMAMIQTAMMGQLPYTVLRDAIFAHPTLAESLNNLCQHFEE